MAEDWIKMRMALLRSPKVVAMASALRPQNVRKMSAKCPSDVHELSTSCPDIVPKSTDRLRVIGGLFAVWCVFDEQSIDGKLVGYTPEAMDEMIGWPGFSSAMAEVKWLIIEPESLVMPRFTDHNGASAKRRCQDAVRKRNARKVTSAKRPQNVRKTSASDADKMRTREEKRREEEKKDILPTVECPKKSKSKTGDPSAVPIPDVLDTPEFRSTWAEWLADRSARGKKVTERAATLQLRQIESLGPVLAAECIRASISAGWAGLFPERFQPSGQTQNRPTAAQQREADAWKVFQFAFGDADSAANSGPQIDDQEPTGGNSLFDEDRAIEAEIIDSRRVS